mgnify:CR=1 FL=1
MIGPIGTSPTGYGAKPPRAKWPGSARLALNFVLNYEEGGENAILHGDKASEAFLSEIIGAQALDGGPDGRCQGERLARGLDQLLQPDVHRAYSR